MIDWIVDNFFWGFIGFLTIVLIMGFISSACDGKETKRLIKQCIEDGRKEYECVAMFRRSYHYDPVTKLTEDD